MDSSTEALTEGPLAAISHFVLRVSDLEKSAAWYAAALGLVPRAVAPGYVSLARPTGDWRIVLREGGAGATDIDHIAFTIADEAAMVAWSDHLRSVGIDHTGPTTTPMGMELALHDPDGMEVELVVEHH